jgi:predicted O-methyltransferase YrrM
MLENGNIYACLVHERQDCVLDLVRNLRCLDPDSPILLYNGGRDPRLIAGCNLEPYGAIVHPRPQPVPWGRLHPFALDCMRFALDHYPFRTLTIVDSDQLAVRPGYSAHLAAFMCDRSGVGMLGNSCTIQLPGTPIPPAQTAHQEIDLWRPFLRRFPRGEDKFVHWSFWPSTVFTAEAARGLTQLFATDRMLQGILSRTKIWASEEILLPTLAALLGYEVLASPYSYDYVQFRKPYTLEQLKDAQARSDVFWLHPVPRLYNDPLRHFVRKSFHNYEHTPMQKEAAMTMPKSQPDEGLLLAWPILERMKQIEGWLAEDEADLLMAATALALARVPDAEAVIEVGSYCGRSTCVLGSVVKALRPTARVYAIDPHDGRVGAAEQSITVMPPTLEKLKRNLSSAGLTDFVNVVVAASWEVTLDQRASLIFIDGLHDYANVARDFHHFEPSLAVGGFAAFHDYADYYPGVKTFVDELLRTGRYERVRCAGSMMVVRRLEGSATPVVATHAARDVADAEPLPSVCVKKRSQLEPDAAAVPPGRVVSCIMPTADRPSLVPQAIQYFLRQDYPNRELIILDDGAAPIEDSIPADSRIRYHRMARRLSMGEKHNLACEMAQGDIIVHWDDDDWMANRRISYQVGELLRQPPMTLCGLARLIYYQPSTDLAWEYVYPQNNRPWVCGNSFCYEKEFWQKNPFPSRNEGADTVWVWGLRNRKVLAHPDHTFYVAIIHSKNTSPKRPGKPLWRQYSSEGVRSLMQDDWTFYSSVSNRL